MLDDFAEAKVPLVILTGGDPAKRPDLFELIQYGSKIGLSMGLTPSATPLVTPTLLQELKDAGLQRLALSIDGLVPDVHDRFRGREGSFARTVQILETAYALNISTQVNTTLHAGTIPVLDKLSAFMSTLGISLWSLFTIVPTGRATESLMPSAEAIEDAYLQILHLSKNVPYAIKTTAGPHYRRLALEERKASGRDIVVGTRGKQAMWVNEGRGFLFVSHRGEVFPSGFLPVSCGNIREQSAIEIYRTHPTFQLLRDSDSLKGKCGKCTYRHVCGGARARAYAMTGDLMASDPVCSYIPPSFSGRVDVFQGQRGNHLQVIQPAARTE